MSMALRVAPVSQEWSDAELVAAVRHGNDTAFEELYSRYGRRICSYVQGMVGDHGRAEDITQEIFIAALRRMRATERPIAFKAWIYEIAKNACIDNFRRSRRTQEVSLDAGDDLSSADRGRLTAVTTLDAVLDTKQALQDLRGAFGSLSDSHHEILVLREFEGRSYSDIGERLGMSRPVVESTLFRARRRLAEEYDELTSGRRCEFVRKMVDSGPHYSLGIRDRRRMARHFAHCQSCRSHARLAGFDESILNMPSVAARIAALLPIPLLRARWGAHRVAGIEQGRQSSLALRSVHTLARSADQIAGASPGAGRGAATAAAIVLAGLGGGIATVSSYLPVDRFHPSGGQAIVAAAGSPTSVRSYAAARSLKGSGAGRAIGSVDVVRLRAGAGKAGAGKSAGSVADGTGASKRKPMTARPGALPAGAGSPGTTSTGAGAGAVPSGTDTSGAAGAASTDPGVGATPVTTGVAGAVAPVTAGLTGVAAPVTAGVGAAGTGVLGGPTETLTGGTPQGSLGGTPPDSAPTSAGPPSGTIASTLGGLAAAAPVLTPVVSNLPAVLGSGGEGSDSPGAG